MADSKETKQALAESLKMLMSERELSKISVGDICSNCGISRKSFYYHFLDKYDLVNQIFKVEYVENILYKNDPNGDGVDNWSALMALCEYFYKNRIFYINAFDESGQNSFTDYFYEVLQPAIIEHLNNELGESADHGFFSLFFTDAFRLAIIRWLREQPQYSPDEFLSLLNKAVKGLAMLIEKDKG